MKLPEFWPFRKRDASVEVAVAHDEPVPPLRPIIKKQVDQTIREMGFKRRSSHFYMVHGIFETKLRTEFRRPAAGVPDILCGVGLVTDSEVIAERLFVNRSAPGMIIPLIDVAAEVLVGRRTAYEAWDLPTASVCAADISKVLRQGIPEYIESLQTEEDFMRLLSKRGPFYRSFVAERYLATLRGEAPKVDMALDFKERFGIE